MNKIKGLFRLIRFELPFSAGVCVVMGQLLALGKFASIFETVFGFWSVFFISAAILALNDYFDIETDKINAPQRPIPSGMVTQQESLWFSLTLVVLGVALSYLLGTITFLCTLILLIVGFLYNRRFKKSGLAGNLMVSFSVGMTFIYGGLSVGLSFSPAVWLFGVIAALVDLGEEIAADAMDMEGDKLIGSGSLAIKYGKIVAIRISSTIFLLVILLTTIPFIMGWFKLVYLLPIGIMDIIITYYAFRLLRSQGEEGRKYIRRIYLGATLGLVIFIVIRLFEA